MSNLNFYRVIYLAITATALSTLVACTSTLSEVDENGLTQAPVFPAMESAARPDGSYVNMENLAKVSTGISKAQIRELIGPPHFAEGMFRVREWDYILKFREPNKTCQYKVLFDRNMVARSFYFSPGNCLKPALS